MSGIIYPEAKHRMLSATRGNWRPTHAMLYREEPCDHYAGWVGRLHRRVDRWLDARDPRALPREHGDKHVEPLFSGEVLPHQLVREGETATVVGEEGATLILIVVAVR